MKPKPLNELEYDLELDGVAKEIKKNKAKRVLIQLPEGLKQWATQISSELKAKTNSNIFIWLNSCFGACDVPLEVEKLGIDMIVQFGHSEFRRNLLDRK